MKNLSLLFIAFLFLQFNSIAQDGWFEQTSGTTATLNSVSFIDENYGWVVGDSGTILFTTNGGISWGFQSCPITDDLTSVQFIDSNNGWIVGGGSLLSTNDGGQIWNDISDTLYTTSAYFVDENNGWRTTRNNSYGCIFKTTDGGITWSEQVCETQAATSFFNVQFISSNIGWAIWKQGLINVDPYLYRTTNGGEDWDNLGQFPIDSYSFVDSANGWSTYNSGDPELYIEIKYTANAGNTWQRQFIQDTFPRPSLNTLNFVNINRGWAAGNEWIFYNNEWISIGRILHTTNSGADWAEQECGMIPSINSIHFVDEYNGWAVGDSGLILQTTSGGVVSVEEENELPKIYSLTQNYPNPFNPSTKMKYSVPELSNVTIKVFDILGNEIETLVNEEKPVGSYEITWYAEGLPSGVYFYQLNAGSFVETKKMLLLK